MAIQIFKFTELFKFTDSVSQAFIDIPFVIDNSQEEEAILKLFQKKFFKQGKSKVPSLWRKQLNCEGIFKLVFKFFFWKKVEKTPLFP